MAHVSCGLAANARRAPCHVVAKLGEGLCIHDAVSRSHSSGSGHSQSRASTGATTSSAMRAPRSNRERIAAEIYENDLHFAAIVGVESAGRIEHRDAVV